MDEYEDAYAKFLVDKLESAGGCLKLEHIRGRLHQLDDEVKKAAGTNPAVDLMRFLLKRDDLFVIEKNGTVSLQRSGVNSLFKLNNSNLQPTSKFPSHLKKCHGVVIKVLPNFGFIASKDPPTSVYFTPACFGEKNLLLTDLIFTGAKVIFNARLGDPKFQSKYQATQVWRSTNIENERPIDGPKFRKTRETGLYDAPSSEGSGKIDKVFENYGYIIINDDPKNTVYFTKQNVCNVENITDLTKLVHKGDEVEYKACKNPPKERTRWKATKVWLKKQKDKKNFKNDKDQAISQNERELKKNQSGKVYPSANGSVIKFGSKFENLADADSCVFYLHGHEVKDVSWEFSDGDSVMVDVIQIRSAPGWRALLSWVGERPNIVVPDDLDLCGYPGGKIDDISDTGSFTSRASSISALSELSHSSETSRNSRSSTSKNRKSRESSGSKHRSSRNDIKSDFRYASQSLSRSSGSSRHSTSNKKHFQKASKDHRSSDRIFTNSSSSIHSRLENDSGFESCRYEPSKREDSSNEKDSQLYSYDSNDDYEDAAKYLPKKSIHTEKKKNIEKKIYTNWGDSPYPDEENNESDENSESVNSGDPYLNEDNNESDLDVGITEICEETSRQSDKSASYKSFQSNYDCNDKQEEICPEFNQSEVNVNTANEISTMTEQFQELNTVENDVECMLEGTTKDDVSVCEEPQIRSYIKHFREIPGTISKVFYRYAEIKNELLKKSTSFFWTDLYVNGQPAPDHFDDLNEVLKEGQTVKFNCIEIVDDSGSCWHKITMAWKGERKPVIKEMTPAEYISENNLVVSVSHDSNDYEVIDASSDKTDQHKPAAPTRKFLTLAVEDEDDQPHLVTESVEPSASIPSKEASDEESSDGNLSDGPSDTRQELLRNSQDTLLGSTSVDLSQLTEAVHRLLSSHRNSEMFPSLEIASDIINLVLSRVGKSSISTTAGTCDQCEKESQTEAVTLTKGLDASSVDHEVNLTETSAQTIITGEVIAQSIFTQ